MFFGVPNNLGLDPFPNQSPILGPLAAILNFAGGSTLLIDGGLGSKYLLWKNCLERP